MTESELTFLAIGLFAGSAAGLLLGAMLSAAAEADRAFNRSVRTLREDPLERAYRDNADAIDHEQSYHYQERIHEA